MNKYRVLLCGLCIAIAKEERSFRIWFVIPLLHFIVHLLATATLFWMVAMLVHSTCVSWFADFCSTGPGLLVSAIARGTLMFLLGGAVGGILFGLYFALMARFGYLDNNAFSAIACEDYKGFLRFRIDADGALNGYFFGCDVIPRKWKMNSSPTGIPGDARPAWEESDSASASWRLCDQFRLLPKRVRT